MAAQRLCSALAQGENWLPQPLFHHSEQPDMSQRPRYRERLPYVAIMKVGHMGGGTSAHWTFSMRILVLSDIHGNLAALETVLDRTQGTYDELWCLGDIVGYGPRPNECVEMIRDQATLCVPGNHDLAVLDQLGTLQFNDMAQEAILWTRAELKVENSAYLAGLEPVPVLVSDMDLLATHGSPRDPVSEYMLDLGTAYDNWNLFTEKFCLVGHTHLPDIFRLRHLDSGTQSREVQVEQLKTTPGTRIALQPHRDHRVFLNPGSVGQPRDKNNRASYALLDREEMTWCNARAEYPIELTQSQMRKAKLPHILIDRLNYGW